MAENVRRPRFLELALALDPRGEEVCRSLARKTAALIEARNNIPENFVGVISARFIPAMAPPLKPFPD